MTVVSFDELKDTIQQAFFAAGLSAQKAETCAHIHASSSLDGINSHGINRVPRFCEYVRNGWVNLDAEPELVSLTGPIEVYDGHQGVGVSNALFANDRAMAIAKERGIGLVALRNTTHWMRGGSYAWLAAEKGFASISWTNTESVMPPWGASECRIGNNPLVIAVPRQKGPLVLDMAMSQYSYGKLQTTRLNGEMMEFPAGFSRSGQITHDPAEVEDSRRIMPTGFWKGSGLSIMLDVLAAILSQGKTTAEIDKVRQGSGTGSSQIFILIDIKKLGMPELAEQLADQVASYVNGAQSISPISSVTYPGESTLQRRKKSMTNGINVDDGIWAQVKTLAAQ